MHLPPRRTRRRALASTLVATAAAVALASFAAPATAATASTAPTATTTAATPTTPASTTAASTTPTATTPAPTATTDQALTARFAHYGDTGGRWTGADSAYSVPLPGGGVAWLYSDTFLGAVNADHSRPADSPFVHNSIVVDRGGRMTTYTGGTASAPESLVTVAGGDEGQDWYWFGDGTVEGSHLRVMLLHFRKTGTGVFDFAYAGSAVASFALPSMRLEGVTDRTAGAVEWGSALLEDGAWTYVYGVEDLQSTKYMHVARVRTNGLLRAPWQFWTGAGWSSDESASARVMDGVANEYSVSRLGGGYALVTTDSTEILSPHVVLYRSSSPVGPFTGKTVLYTTPETSGNVFTYNAKAHPELGDRDTLVVTYNVNSFDTADVYANVDNYRPRYLDVRFGR